MLVAYLQDTQLTVVTGNGGLPAGVDRILTCGNLNGLVRDGLIVDPTGFANTVGEFWRSNNLDTKGVKVVVRTRRITLQSIETPYFRRERDLRTWTTQEAQANSQLSEPCVTLLVAQPDRQANQTHTLVAVADKGLLQHLVDAFSAMGVTVDAISSPHTAGIALTHELAGQHQQETVLYLSADADQAFATLYRSGVYEYSSEQHLFTEYGTADFGRELLRQVTNIEQFMQGQHIASRFDRICLYAMDERGTQAVRAALNDYDASVPVEVLPQDRLFVGGSSLSDADAGTDGGVSPLQGAFPAIAGLATPQDGGQLVQAYREATGTGMSTNDRQDLLRSLILPGICLAACLAVIAGLGVSNLLLGRQVDSLRAQATTPAAMSQLMSYDAAKQQSDLANQTADSSSRLTSALDGYPVPGRNLEATIATCADGLVVSYTSGYDESSGTYIVRAVTGNDANFSAFVQRLIDAGSNGGGFTVTNTGYEGVEVTGSSQDESTVNLWTATVVLTLDAGEGR